MAATGNVKPASPVSTWAAKLKAKPTIVAKTQQVATATSLKSAEEEKAVDYSKARVRTISQVHQDDIHCLHKLSNGTFISGSKDCCLKQWSLEDGKLVKVVYAPKQGSKYTQWITALGSAGNGGWLSGTRDGLVDHWDADGNWKKTLLESAPPDRGNKCKERNKTRVQHLAPLPGTEQFIVSWPTQFAIHDLADGEQRQAYTTGANDWVYVTLPYSETKLLVVVGCVLELWERASTSTLEWQKRTTLLEEDPKRREETDRHYISAITQLQKNPSHLGASLFGGVIKVYDVGVQKLLWSAEEHVGRVWMIENIDINTFASCADDGCIKIWDSRTQAKSVTSLKDNGKEKARVSVLMKIRDGILLSGSCPDDVHKSQSKAQFSFWDLRRSK